MQSILEELRNSKEFDYMLICLWVVFIARILVLFDWILYSKCTSRSLLVSAHRVRVLHCRRRDWSSRNRRWLDEQLP